MKVDRRMIVSRVGTAARVALAFLLLVPPAMLLGATRVHAQECGLCKEPPESPRRGLPGPEPPQVTLTAAVTPLPTPYSVRASKEALKWPDAELKKMSVEEK